jgi:hypothetical protein
MIAAQDGGLAGVIPIENDRRKLDATLELRDELFDMVGIDRIAEASLIPNSRDASVSSSFTGNAG